MSRQSMIDEIVRIVAPGDAEEQRRLRHWHNQRRTADIRETLLRQRAIAAVTPDECALHCQPYRIAR